MEHVEDKSRRDRVGRIEQELFGDSSRERTAGNGEKNAHGTASERAVAIPQLHSLSSHAIPCDGSPVVPTKKVFMWNADGFGRGTTQGGSCGTPAVSETI